MNILPPLPQKSGIYQRAIIHRVSIDDRQTISVTLKSHALNIFEEPQNNLWTFDLEGRLIGMYVNGINYRRTLDNHFFKKTRRRFNGETYREVNPISMDEAKRMLEKGQTFLKRVESELPVSFKFYVRKVLDMDITRLTESGERFSRIYLPISILPPDQYMALVLQITEGCNYNQCTFCNFYRDRPFHIKTVEEIEHHFKDVKSFFGEGIKLRKSIFLADANALVIPQKKLVTFLELIRCKFPDIPRLYSFIDVFTGTKKSTEDFSTLAGFGLNRVYLGVESGNSELLDFLHKPQLTDDILEVSNHLKMGGVRLGIIFLVGAGGEFFRQKHLEDSLKLVKRLPLDSGDIIYISEFYETNPQYRSTMETRGIEVPTRLDIRTMSTEFKAAVKQMVPKGVSVSIYDIQQFIY